MQFIHNIDAGKLELNICDETYRYIIKARRHKISDLIYFRNLSDDFLYSYEIKNISRKDVLLNLLSKDEKVIEANKKLHLIWCIVDIKTIEKQLPYLNEIGVDKISFAYSEYSQKSFKINFEKLEKILINSSSQCGRSSIIKLDVISNLDEYIKKNNDLYMLNFSKNKILANEEYEKVLIGCEGGFSKDEIDNFSANKIIGLNTNMILKSQTAISSLASKILL